MEPSNPSAYRPESVIQHFDDYGAREWTRLIHTPADEVSLAIHTHYLEKYVAAGDRVLEIGAGAGRFTQILGRIGARVWVADISPGQLELNRRFASEYGFEAAVADRRQVDICDLSGYEDDAFDAVVAYGGPLSYVLDRRDAALAECLRVLRPGGALLLSVMSLWGSAHRRLDGVLDMAVADNQKVTSTGDISPATFPDRKSGFMHLFRADELLAWLKAASLTLLDASASGCLATRWDAELGPIRANPEKWSELLRMEIEASADPACLGMGTHMIAAARKSNADP